MKAKVGSLEVIDTQCLIIPEGEEGWVSPNVQGWEPKLRVRFASDPSATGQQISVSVENDEAVLLLKNWTNSLGTATLKPIQFATVSTGGTVFVMLTHWRIGTVNRLDLQFLLEAI